MPTALGLITAISVLCVMVKLENVKREMASKALIAQIEQEENRSKR